MKQSCAFLIPILLAWSGATRAQQAAVPHLTKVSDQVYVWSDLHPTGLYNTNNLIVLTSAGVLVADGQKDAETTQKMVDAIRTLTRQPIRYVVIGSEHGDHTGGNKAFPSTSTFIKYPLVANPMILKMGSTEIHVVFNGRAHTGTDLEVYLPKEKIFFVSEVFSNHIFPNMRAAVPSEWLQTVKRIRQVNATLVIPGHGSLATAAILKAELAAFEQALESAIGAVTRVRQTGATVQEAQKLVDWGTYGTWTAADRNGPVAIQRIYDEAAGTLK
jgi:glyoxylase-like metal-dependent hydrolase (beta-lactamase superfamily II)